MPKRTELHVGDDCSTNLSRTQFDEGQVIINNWKKKDSKVMYADKAVRRESQENMRNTLLNEIHNDEHSQYDKCVRLTETITKVNDQFHKIELGADGKELCRDSKILVNAANLLYKKTSHLLAGDMKQQFNFSRFHSHLKQYTFDAAKEMRQNGSYETDVLPSHIDTQFSTQECDYNADNVLFYLELWAVIGSKSRRVTKCAPGNAYILPLLDTKGLNGPTEKKQRKTKDKKAEKEEKEVVIEQKKQEELSTKESTISKELDYVLKCLKKALKKNNGSISYYGFVIDPTSFGRTVENIFHVSFLVRDCIAMLKLDDNNLPRLYIIKSDERNRLQSDDSENPTIQSILPFNYKLWKGMIEALKITEPMIPNLEDCS